MPLPVPLPSHLAALGEAVVGNKVHDLGAVLLLGHHPPGHLVERLRVASRGRQLADLDHGLADGRARLADLGHDHGVIKDAARHLAVATAEAEHQVKGRLLLDVVVTKGPTILKLLAREDKALLVRRDALLVLDLLLHVLDGVRRLHIEGDGLAGEGFDEDLAGMGMVMAGEE